MIAKLSIVGKEEINLAIFWKLLKKVIDDEMKITLIAQQVPELRLINKLETSYVN